MIELKIRHGLLDYVYIIEYDAHVINIYGDNNMSKWRDLGSEEGRERIIESAKEIVKDVLEDIAEKAKEVGKMFEQAAKRSEKPLEEVVDTIKDGVDCVQHLSTYKKLAAMKKEDCTADTVLKFLSIKSDVKTLSSDEVALQQRLSNSEFSIETDCSYYSNEISAYNTKIIDECGVKPVDITEL